MYLDNVFSNSLLIHVLAEYLFSVKSFLSDLVSETSSAQKYGI